mgnify:CR=1 FL=1
MKTKHLRLMQRVYIVLFFCFMYLPIAYMIVFSFNQSKGYSLFTGFTLKWYSSLLHNSSILHALLVSLEVALISAVIATVLGTAASLGIASMGRGSRLVVTNITYIPVVNPEIITGISLMLLFVAYQRFAGGVSWLPDTIMGFPTLLIAHIAFNVPYVIFNVTPKLKQLDIKLYEAALDLGCDPKQAFFKVILPEISPAILSAFLICLTYSIDDFMISYFNCGTVETLQAALRNDKENFFIPTSGNDLTLLKIIPQLTLLVRDNPEARIHLFGYPEWQTYTKDHLESFFELDTYFYSSFYTNNLLPAAINFTHAYRKWYSKEMEERYPKYGMLGFDTGYFFLKGLSKYGSELEKNLPLMDLTPIQTGFKFQRVNNWGGFVNKKVFFVHFTKNFELIKLDFE